MCACVSCVRFERKCRAFIESERKRVMCLPKGEIWNHTLSDDDTIELGDLGVVGVFYVPSRTRAKVLPSKYVL